MLKERLKQVGNLVDNKHLVDIGTDHGYLIIDLLKRGQIKSAMAVEITKGPLDNVTTNVKNHRLSDKVECFLSDGLTKVDADALTKYDSISICGMGGALIAKILTDSANEVTDKTLYLQPNNGEVALRRTLVSLGFRITNEMVITDNNIYYEIIKAVPGKSELTEKELYFGPINLIQKDSVFTSKHIEHYNHLMQINDKLIENNKHNQKIIDEINLLKEEFNEII
ncbi:tRNA (adenine(22)-N(1))-methyltransferase TrmK [Mollicutes bacterium LVI A0078]|nr:tRNA (adenine(22)-N(1))-methyltransferase TrmK [Mollicutes bacterium LVI A0075]WOO91096.1 tRNA (adenine(22)-N(1))-methyltransferase TrmK [Mollicutes bacterium LVI A0078]